MTTCPICGHAYDNLHSAHSENECTEVLLDTIIRLRAVLAGERTAWESAIRERDAARAQVERLRGRITVALRCITSPSTLCERACEILNDALAEASPATTDRTDLTEDGAKHEGD